MGRGRWSLPHLQVARILHRHPGAQGKEGPNRGYGIHKPVQPEHLGMVSNGNETQQIDPILYTSRTSKRPFPHGRLAGDATGHEGRDRHGLPRHLYHPALCLAGGGTSRASVT
jgi:hypothetical protein